MTSFFVVRTHINRPKGQNWSFCVFLTCAMANFNISLKKSIIFNLKRLAMSRHHHKKTDIKLDLIKALRRNPMSKERIKEFLSQEFRLLGRYNKQTGLIDDYTVSDKTVQRMIASLKEEYSEDVFFMNDYGCYEFHLCSFPDTITEEDIQALDIVIKKSIKDANLKENLKELKAKLSSKLEMIRGHKESEDFEDKLQRTNFFVVGPQAQINTDKNVQKTLMTAIHIQNKVKITHHGNEHTVCPLSILHGPNNDYLVALMDEKNPDSIRSFKMEKISSAIDLGIWFEKDNNFSMQKYANSMFGIPYNDETRKEYDVEWLVPKKIKHEAIRYTFHPDQNIIPLPDGSLKITFHANNLEAIAKYICQWGGAIIPVAPKELVNKYKELLKTCLDSVKK